ncbi:MAG: FxsA family protein [Actinomycetia bacterium]|nr:FxsA family protein [Actinomycetes bacterium]
MRRLLMFVGVPLLELYVLSVVEDRIGLANTLGLVVATGLLGAVVMKRQGAEVWRSAQIRVAKGELPAEEIIGGIMVLVGGALMITPGIITDAVGLLLMIPAVRSLIIPVWSKKRFFVTLKGRDNGVYDIDPS